MPENGIYGGVKVSRKNDDQIAKCVGDSHTKDFLGGGYW